MATYSPHTNAYRDPSNIETQLAQMLVSGQGNPGTLALLTGYGAERGIAAGTQDAYNSMITMLQRQQAQAENSQKAAGTVVDGLKLISDNPGHAAALTSNPITGGYFANTNLTPGIEEASMNTTATRVGTAGRGIGSMAMGGYDIDPVAAGRILGAGVTKGASPIVQAAALRAGGEQRLTETITTDPNGNTTRAIKGSPGAANQAYLNNTANNPPPRIGTATPPPSANAPVRLSPRMTPDQRNLATKDVLATGKPPVYVKEGNATYVVGASGQRWLSQ